MVIRPTSLWSHFARNLRQSAHRILENLDQARSLIAERSTNGGGRLTVGAPYSMCQALMPAVVAAFHKCLPGTHLSLVGLEPMDAVERLVRRDIDFALTLNPVRHKALATMDAGRDEVVIVASDQSPVSSLERLQASDLQSQAMILPTNPNAEYAVWSGFMLEAGVFPRITLETDSIELAIALVREGLGLTVAPRWAIPPVTNGLAARSIGRAGLWRTWSIAYPASLRLTSIHRAFLRICGERLNLGSTGASTPAPSEDSTSWRRTATVE